MHPDRDDLLARIYRLGDAHRQRRRRLLAGGSTLAVLAVAVLAVGLVDSDDDRRTSLATEGDSSTTTSEVTSTTAAEATTTTVESSTTTSLVCRNSTNPACGAFYYDWPAPNTPATVTITASPASPRLGEEVTFTITVEDPDGTYLGGQCSRFELLHPPQVVPDKEPRRYTRVDGPGCPATVFPGYGPWDPPAPAHYSFELRATFENTPGPHRLRYSFTEGGYCSPPEGRPRCGVETSAELVIELQPYATTTAAP